MFNRDNLSESADRIVALLSKDEVDPNETNAALKELVGKARHGTKQERDDIVSRFALLIPNLRIMRAAALAIGSGALVEQGAAFEPMAEPTLTRFAEAAHGAIPFVEACRAMAKTEGARTSNAAMDAPEEGDEPEPAGDDSDDAINTFGERVAEQMPDAARAFSALQMLWAASLAVLQRSKPLRRQFRQSMAVIVDVQRLEALGIDLDCSREMLSL
ncbi:MAG TPA: hypothetical protein VGS80_20090, partial [Ktedonobacterales bacterium]|nr:hypothetical protein [Ktedonobacterales bacterium]